MENVFEDLLGESTSSTETQTSEVSSSATETSELGEEFTLDVDDLLSDENENIESEQSDEDEETEVTIEDDNDNVVDNPTNSAFAQMRTQNKEYANKLNELDALAKAAGLRDVDDLIAKSKEAQIKKQAQAQGIPTEVARELAEMREFREEIRTRDAQAAQQAKEQTLVNNVQNFISQNNLAKDTVQKLSDSLEKDGLTLDYLMDLPKAALNRVLTSYIGGANQKNLERKDAIKNELPLSQTSKIDNNALLKEIDDLARQFAGK